MAQAVQQPLPSQRDSIAANGGSGNLVFQNLFGFVPAAYKASTPATAPVPAKRRGKAKKPQELVGR